MTAARTGYTATLLNNGKALLAGGCGPPRGLASAELYDPVTDIFVRTGNMTTARCRARATLLATGKVLIVSGEEGDDYESAEIYDPATGTFKLTDWKKH